MNDRAPLDINFSPMMEEVALGEQRSFRGFGLMIAFVLVCGIGAAALCKKKITRNRWLKESFVTI